MKNNIVFYIRALFHESIMPGNEKNNKPNMIKLVDIFNQFSKISVQEYRTKVHEIQIKNLSKISNRIIYNNAEINLKRKFNYTYSILQKQTIEKFKQLNDEDFVIPLDDDDWLSPEIANLDFKKNALNCWNCISFSHNQKIIGVFEHARNKYIPDVIETEIQLEDSRGLLSNCQCIPAFLIKHLISINRIDILQPLLQRHTTPRRLIRESPIKEINIKENLIDESLAVYVRHAANVTLFDKMSNYGKEDDYSLELYNNAITPYKLADYKNIKNLSPCYEWTLEYLEELKELNQIL